MGLTFIASATADDEDPATISFIDGTGGVVFDNTYDEYQFYFVNIHPGTDNKIFQFQVNATDDAGGGYDTSPITSTAFRAYHGEDDATAIVTYRDAMDEANAANYQDLSEWGSTDNDASISGTLTIYDPSSAYIKHFIAEVNDNYDGTSLANYHVAGYINDRTAIDEINFMMDTGDIQSGTIYMYGVS